MIRETRFRDGIDLRRKQSAAGANGAPFRTSCCTVAFRETDYIKRSRMRKPSHERSADQSLRSARKRCLVLPGI
ncbi:unnamed protein product, partial [Iphiclides podalirius]